MNGRTHAYLDLAALPPGRRTAVRPAAGDGLPRRRQRDPLGQCRRLSHSSASPTSARCSTAASARTSPLAPHLARLAKAPRRPRPGGAPPLQFRRDPVGAGRGLPAARPRPAAATPPCSPVRLARAQRESLSTRAERLADAIAGADSLAAVLDRDGRVLGASGGFDALEPASAALDALILEAGAGDRRVLRRAVRVGRPPATPGWCAWRSATSVSSSSWSGPSRR